MFKSNSDVVFGDVNLAEAKVRSAADGSALNPGAGGWPTVRHFNKQTGVAGVAYVQKTDKAMCEELKDLDTMKAYVMEAAGTSLCSAATGAGCNEREREYAAKWAAKPVEEVRSQKARLDKMAGASLASEAKTWIGQRRALLGQLARDSSEEL